MLRGVYGAAGHGRETMPLARTAAPTGAEFVFVDDDPAVPGMVNGHRVLTFDAFLAAPARDKRVVIAVADAATRRRLVERVSAAGIGFFSVIAPNAVIGDDVEIGEGAIISAFALLTSNIRLGCHVHVNMHAYVAHDARVADFVTFGPAVCCNGHVHVGPGAYLGAGAMIRQGAPGAPRRIGRAAVVGMGAVVLDDVPEAATVVGNPARPIGEGNRC